MTIMISRSCLLRDWGPGLHEDHLEVGGLGARLAMVAIQRDGEDQEVFLNDLLLSEAPGRGRHVWSLDSITATAVVGYCGISKVAVEMKLNLRSTSYPTPWTNFVASL